MFAGIIKEIGTVEDIRPNGASRRIAIKAGNLFNDARVGDSISVEGVCLTIVDKKQNLLYFDIIGETLKGTTLNLLKKKDSVNLEPSLELKDRISGHLITGHIDEVGEIRRIKRYGEEIMQLTIGIKPNRESLLVQKGSVAIDGISLTVNGIGRDFFIVDIIPHTFKATTLHLKNVGDKVNIEFDIIGKYVQKSISMPPKTIDEDFLKEEGFI